MTTTATSHVRLNTSVLASVEKRALIWIARRLPPWVNSDHLTVLAAVSIAGAGGAFWAARYWLPALWLVVVALALNWFGDSLDGTLARVRKHERPRYGFYVDHVLDVVGISVLFGGMALSGFITPVIALLLLVAYLLVAAEVFLATAVNGQFRMSFLSFGPTELRIVLAAGALRLLSGPTVNPFGLGDVLLFDVGAIIATAGLTVALVTSASRTTLALYRAEPLPAQARPDKVRPAGPGLARTTATLVALCLLIAPRVVDAATLAPSTVAAWNSHVALTEARIERELSSWRRSLSVEEPRGTTTGVDGGLIAGWRGSVFLPGVQLDALLHRLRHPHEHGPHQEDVLAVRVLDRGPDSLDLFIRMTRTKIVTVTYDTEHHVEYRRHGALRASSRSVATRIAELDDEGRRKTPGEDRGFLWRMNAYWRYEQVRGGVIVDLESLTLSRGIPLGLGTVVTPLINRIARESMSRTLDNIRRTYS